MARAPGQKIACNSLRYYGRMLRYQVAFHFPHAQGEMVVAEALDFPGAVSQGFDLPDARLMIASAMDRSCGTPVGRGKAFAEPGRIRDRCRPDRTRAAVGARRHFPSVIEVTAVARLARLICHKLGVAPIRRPGVILQGGCIFGFSGMSSGCYAFRAGRHSGQW